MGEGIWGFDCWFRFVCLVDLVIVGRLFGGFGCVAVGGFVGVFFVGGDWCGGFLILWMCG